jgi:hypothetical protein
MLKNVLLVIFCAFTFADNVIASIEISHNGNVFRVTAHKNPDDICYICVNGVQSEMWISETGHPYIIADKRKVGKLTIKVFLIGAY